MASRASAQARPMVETTDAVPVTAEPFTLAALDLLLQPGEGPCVSLLLPTHPRGVDAEQDPVRFGNLVRDAETQLLARGMPLEEAQQFLKVVRRLEQASSFWAQQRDGLAIFVAPGRVVAYRVPLSLHERAVVGDAFYVRPLLPLLSGDGHAFVLTLSQNQIGLWRVTRDAITPVDLPDGVPLNIDAALSMDDPQRESQFNTQGPQFGQRRSAVFYGTSAEPDVRTDDLLRFCQRVDRGLQPLLHDQRAPLVLAAVRELHPIYRKANTYAHLTATGVLRQPDRLHADELHARAWTIVAPEFQAKQTVAAARYRQLAGTGRTSDDISEILPAARDGRVATLFMSTEAHIWGAIDASGNITARHTAYAPGDRDLMELAAIDVLRQGGEVFAAPADEMPAGGSLECIYRY